MSGLKNRQIGGILGFFFAIVVDQKIYKTRNQTRKLVLFLSITLSGFGLGALSEAKQPIESET